ncbi:immunity 41 family protein [Neisseriaceae bacterium JH1-16]|nr:immunity 41 family protein [Neisseriaceae bacterium JH1-16]
MNPIQVVARNFPWSPEQDDESFTGQLHEKSIWCQNEYWLLEWALYKLAPNPQSSQEIHWQVFNIFSSCLAKISYHLDPNDGFEIKNIENRAIYDWRERIQLVFEGFFKGEMPDQAWFEENNPLLIATHGKQQKED